MDEERNISRRAEGVEMFQLATKTGLDRVYIYTSTPTPVWDDEIWREIG